MPDQPTKSDIKVNEASRSKDRGSEANPADSAENDDRPSMTISDPQSGERDVVTPEDAE